MKAKLINKFKKLRPYLLNVIGNHTVNICFKPKYV